MVSLYTVIISNGFSSTATKAERKLLLLLLLLWKVIASILKLVLELVMKTDQSGWMAVPALNGVKDALGYDFRLRMLNLEHRNDTPETVQHETLLLESLDSTNPLQEKKKKE